MKKILILSLILIAAACNKQEYYQNNPNVPTSATPSLLLTGICYGVFYNDPTDPAFAARYLTYYERPNDNVNYGWITSGFDPYNTLRQVQQMEKLAIASGENYYLGIAKFFRAVIFSQLTDRFGDIPYSQSLKAESGIDRPVYDTQADVYKGLLEELEQANTIFSGAGTPINGDIIFNGNIQKWQKAVNALRLRLLIHLSKKENDLNLNVKQQFSSIISDPVRYPLMTGNEDNAQLVFNTTAPDNYYPIFNSLSVSSLVSLEEGVVKLLKDRNDPRLFRFGDPIVGQPANVLGSYAGINAGLIISDQQNAAPNASKIHRRYVDSEVGEPLILIGYSEQEFIRAEGIARGWATGNALGHYNNGMRASMQFHGIGGITIEQYFNRPNVKYDETNAISLILTQKYLALFMQSGWEPFFEQRRTGIPTFNVGPATLNNGQIPKRWRYPQSEFQQNRVNMEAAIARQYPGGDDVNGMMWLLQ
jgi:Starch-binding associating with outer membrane